MTITIVEQAKKELEQEYFRQKVENAKARLKRPWWVRFFPFKITFKIERR